MLHRGLVANRPVAHKTFSLPGAIRPGQDTELVVGQRTYFLTLPPLFRVSDSLSKTFRVSEFRGASTACNNVAGHKTAHGGIVSVSRGDGGKYVCRHVHKHMYLLHRHAHAHAHVGAHANVEVCAHAHMHTRPNNTHVDIPVCMYVCMYVCMFWLPRGTIRGYCIAGDKCYSCDCSNQAQGSSVQLGGAE